MAGKIDGTWEPDVEGETLSAARRSRLKSETSGTDSADLTRLLDLVAAFPRQTIALLGDMVLDQFVSGDIARVSREAPVLILRHRATRAFPGGGANALNNLVDLGAKVLAVGAVGDDASGRSLLEILRRKRVNTSGIVTVRRWTTPTKTRFLAGWTHTSEQQVLRVDDDPREPLPERVQRALGAKLRERVRRAGALLLSDYGFGAAASSVVGAIKTEKHVTLDSRYRLLDFKRTAVTSATPNEAELESIYGEKIGQDAAKLEALALRTLEDMHLQALLVTRGKDGMALFEKDQPTQTIPVFGSEEAMDVTGAGDTVIAVFTLALAAGANYLEAAHLANYAGGIVVMKRGTATVTRAELESAVRSAAISAA
jgi:D-glycero-beta-D-manno-heptose-7-phosphate kinase